MFPWALYSMTPSIYIFTWFSVDEIPWNEKLSSSACGMLNSSIILDLRW